MMDATNTSEISVNFYQTTQRNNPEDSHIRTRRRENLKSYSSQKFARPDILAFTWHGVMFHYGSMDYLRENVVDSSWKGSILRAP
jgi:hypothetical protein